MVQFERLTLNQNDADILFRIILIICHLGKSVFLPRVVRSLGEGSFAKVELIRCSKTGALFAMKKLRNGKKAHREIDACLTIMTIKNQSR